jgi:hypothetical protein
MQNRNQDKVGRRATGPYAELANLKISKRDKYAWVAAGVAIVVLLLAWWARSSH